MLQGQKTQLAGGKKMAIFKQALMNERVSFLRNSVVLRRRRNEIQRLISFDCRLKASQACVR